MANNIVPVKRDGVDGYLIVDSASVLWAGHERERMVVLFKQGDFYTYRHVPKSTWQGFLDDPSRGHFLEKEVKGKYDYEKGINVPGRIRYAWERFSRRLGVGRRVQAGGSQDC